ncbi:MAG: hypothetical protein ACI82Z_001140 [Cellvibrionaceae bacterium]|jgi:uncharacterized protein (TIGR02099 family)
MIQRLKKPIKSVLYLLAFGIITVALTVQAARIAIPLITYYKSDLERFASRQLQAEVKFSHISGRWHGLLPEITLSDLSIVLPGDQPVLNVEHASMRLDILTSLQYWFPVWRDVELRRLNVTVQQNANGGWSLGGLTPREKGNEPGYYYRNPGSLFLMATEVSVTSSNVHFIFHNGRRLRTSVPSIRIRNDERFHRLNVQASVDGKNILNFVMEGVGDPSNPKEFSANAFLELKQFPIERVAKLFAQVTSFPEDTRLLPSDNAANIDLKLWFDFNSSSEFLMNGHVDLIVDQASEFAKTNLLDIPFESDISGNYSIQDGLKIGLRNSLLDEKIRLSPMALQLHDDKLKVATKTFDLATFSQWIIGKELLSGVPGDMFETLSPSGQVENLLFTLDLLDIQQSLLQADIRDGQSRAWNKIPGFSGVNGFLESSLKKGFLLLETENFSIYPKSLYEKPLSTKTAEGLVQWSLDSKINRISIGGQRLKVTGDFGVGHGFFELLSPWKEGSYESELTLQIGLEDSHSDYYPEFLPNRFPEKLRAWMDESIETAIVNEAGFLYRGGLGEESVRSIQFFANIEDGLLKNEGWPDLSKINGQLVVNARQLDATINKASFYEDQFSGRVSWNKNNQNRLRIVANGTSEATSGLNFIKNTWLNDRTNGFFETWSATGVLNVKADVSLALTETARQVQVSTQIGFNNNYLHLPSQKLDFHQVNGNFIYSSKTGFDSQDLRARFFDKPLMVDFEGGNSQQPNLSIAARGSVSAKDLAIWSEQPVDRIAEGDSDFTANFIIPLDGESDQKPKMIVKSDLQGLALNLPEPYFKASATAREIELVGNFDNDGRDFSFNYSDQLAGRLSLENNRNVKLTLSLSDDFAEPLDQTSSSGIYIQGRFNTLNIKDWIERFKTLSNLSGASATLDDSIPINFDLVINNTFYGDTNLAKLRLTGERTAEFWNTTIDSPRVEGGIRIPHAGGPWIFELDSVQLSSGQKRSPNAINPVDVLKNISLESIWPADVVIEQLSYREKLLGRWSFQLRANDRGIELQNIKARLGELSLRGSQEGVGAHLRWQFPSDQGEMYTRFTGFVQGGDIKTLFESLQVPPALESESTDLAMIFEWPGSPVNISAAQLKGQLQFDFKKGSFVQDEQNTLAGTGLLKFIGLMNFDTWARRIRLDFSDLSRPGLVFDILQGSMVIENGLIKTQSPVVAEGPSTKLSLSVQVDTQSQSLDGELTATLPIGGNLTAIAALAAGLPAAAGIYLISRLFKRQVDAASTIIYDISGSLDEPEVKVRGLKNQTEDEIFSEDGLG